MTQLSHSPPLLPPAIRSRISAATRSPDRMAPSTAPCDTVAVSVPAQCTRPWRARSNVPYRVRKPGGRWANEQPHVQGSEYQAVSTNSTGAAARGPKRSETVSSNSRCRSVAGRESNRLATEANRKVASAPNDPSAGEASMVTSAGDPAPALWPLKPSARQNGLS